MAGTWKMFNNAKLILGQAGLALPGTYRMALFTSACNLKTSASARPRVSKGELTNEVANNFGYVTSGQSLGGEVWNTSISARTLMWRYSLNPATGTGKWSASGGTISAIKYAAIFFSGTTGARKLLCYVTLTTGTGGISLADTNTLAVKPAATGIFNLSGM